MRTEQLICATITLLRLCVHALFSGMTSKVLESVFTPFCQGETFLTRQHPGSGLGLSICKKLTDLMFGNLKVESAPGIGSTLYFSVPVGREAVGTTGAHMSQSVQAFSDAVSKPPSKPCADILVAEDSGVNQKVLVRVLQKLGYDPNHVHLVDNGLQVWSVTLFYLVREHKE
jgi:Histidine kinase-, DNA gyrase B-, and HSP90-like ATPase